MPARRHEPTERGLSRRERLGVEALRIPVAREGDDLLLGELAGAVFKNPADCKVFPVVAECTHAAFFSKSREASTPKTSPQNGAPMRKIETSATVTRKQISAPNVARPANDATNAFCRTRSMAS